MEVEFECPKCKDTEFVIFSKPSTNGYIYDFSVPCECREKKAWQRRFKNALIPEKFTKATFENYERKSSHQVVMYQMARDYLKLFRIIESPTGEKEKIIPPNNFGMIALFGEQRLKQLQPSERYEVKKNHNSFGIGKTHLQMALAKRLIKDGFNVLIVSDVTFIEELMQAKKLNDAGETYNKIMHNVLTADVLVWDDIGKVNWTEARERMYYTIINERYSKQRPIIFNSNEDRGTLAEKIGNAAAGRLIGEASDFLSEEEGQDWRLTKGATAHA